MKSKLGLYIHIPFCKRKCFYCDFVSGSYNTDFADCYVDALVKESLQYQNESLYSIYIGGGTPSMLSEEQLKKLISHIKNNFNISNLEEFTVELNPESTTIEKLQVLYDMGITRLSFGLQSTIDKYLSTLGRLHNYKTFVEVYNTAIKIGFDNINIDLIYGIPNQTVSEWKNDLIQVINLNSNHISLYPLTIEQGTVFYQNRINTDSNLQRIMYDKACDILEKNNFIHYEISNWAKKNKYSKHNVLYWQNCQYIGLGTSASSYYKRYRYKNVTDTLKYIDYVNNNKNLKIENEYIDDKLYDIETIMLGLRLKEGVDVKYFKDKQDILNKFILDGMLEINNNKVLLTKKSLFVSNSVISEFIF